MFPNLIMLYARFGSVIGRTSRTRSRRRCSVQCKNVSGNFVVVNLLKWMKENGWTPACPLRLTEFPISGRGFMSRQKIEKGDSLMQVPTSLLITTATVYYSAGGLLLKKQMLLQEDLVFSSQQLLTYFLVWESHLGEDSFWNKYILTLPSTFSTPHSLEEKYITALPDFLRDVIVNLKRVVHRNWLHLLSNLKSYTCRHCKQNACEIVSWNRFLWGWCCVNTRAVYIEPKLVPPHKLYVQDRDCLALAPYLDMFNHSDSAEVNARLNTLNNCYEILTLKPIRKFEEVLINYGPHSNIKLYSEYGFVLSSNVHDIIPLTFLELKAAFLSAGRNLLHEYEKERFITQHGFMENMFVSRTGLSWNTVTSLEILSCSTQNTKVWKSIAYSGNERSLNLISSEISHVVNTLLNNIRMNLLDSIQKLADDECDVLCLKMSKTLLSELLSVVLDASLVYKSTSSLYLKQ